MKASRRENAKLFAEGAMGMLVFNSSLRSLRMHFLAPLRLLFVKASRRENAEDVSQLGTGSQVPIAIA